ncbi:4508_t:CDS:2, partial [Gigaspora rosea]
YEVINAIAENNVIRDLIRTLYLRQKKDLIDDKVDFKFILGKSSDENISKLIAENNTYGDIIILDVKENMNDGKAHYYWKWVGLNLNTTKYDYAAKTDDDSFVHFQNLALDRQLQVLSVNYAYLFVSIPFDRKEWNGAEDYMLGLWLNKYTNSTLNRFNENCLMLHDPRVPITSSTWKHWASPHTIVIHWLKDPAAWQSVIDFYFV